MGNKNKRRVAASPQEAKLAEEAQKLLQQGSKNFESTYGPTNSGAVFNPEEDRLAMLEMQSMSNDPPPVSLPNAPEAKPIPQPTKEEKQAKEEQPEESEEVLETTGDPRIDCPKIAEELAKSLPGMNTPSANALYDWKITHGDIYVLPVAGRVFIYRYLKRQEWIMMNTKDEFNNMREDQINEWIYNKCLLWPILDPVQSAGLPAGAIDMVVQQIKLQSLFLDPSFVSTLTIKI